MAPAAKPAAAKPAMVSAARKAPARVGAAATRAPVAPRTPASSRPTAGGGGDSKRLQGQVDDLNTQLATMKDSLESLEKVMTKVVSSFVISILNRSETSTLKNCEISSSCAIMSVARKLQSKSTLNQKRIK